MSLNSRRDSSRARSVILLIPALLLTCLALLHAQQVAAPPTKKIAIETLLPAKTIVYATIPDLTATIARCKKTALWEIWQEPDVQVFAAPIIAAIKNALLSEQLKFEKETQVTWEEISAQFGGQMAFAFVDFSVRPPAPPTAPGAAATPAPAAAGPAKPYSLAFFFTPDVPQTFDNVVTRLLAVLKTPDHGFVCEPFTVDDAQVEAYSKPKAPDSPVICRTRLGDTFVFTIATGREAIGPIIRAYKQKPDAPTLAQNPAFQRVRTQLYGDQADVFVYGSVASLLERLAPVTSAKARDVLRSTGASSIQAVGLGAKVEDRGIRDGIYVYAPQERTGFVNLLAAKPVDPALMDLVPNTAHGFLLSRVDLLGLWTTIDDIVHSAAGEADYAKFKEKIAEFERNAGISLTDDLFAPLGRETLVYSIPSTLGGATWGFGDLSFLFTLQGKPRIQGALDKLAAYIADESARNAAERANVDTGSRGGPPLLFWQESKVKDYTMNTMSFAEPSSVPIPVNPAYAFTEKYLIIGLTPVGCTATIEAATTPIPAGQRLCDTADFKSVFPKIPQGQGLIGYCDLQRSFTNTYNMLKLPLNALAVQPGFPVDATKLPAPEVISRHLFGQIVGLRSDAEGIFFEGYSPIGSTAPPAVAAIAAAALLPAVMRARTATNDAVAIGALKTIATQQAIFRQQAEIDQNNNGVGEYGLLGELAGELALRPASAKHVNPAYISMLYKTGGSAGQGFATKSGYNFRIYLASGPDTAGDDRTLGGTAATGGPPSPPDAIALQEKTFALYAWPVEIRGLDPRAFFVNEVGEVYATRMETTKYAGAKVPAPDAAYAKGHKAFDGRELGAGPGNDGNNWAPIREDAPRRAQQPRRE